MNETLENQISNLSESDLANFNITANGTIVCNHQIVLSYLLNKYSNWKNNNLKITFSLFIQLTQLDINRAYNAFYSDYNPIDNYNGTETRTIIENTGKKISRNEGGTTVENSSTTFENENYRPTEKTDTIFNNLKSSEEFENTSIGENSGHHVTSETYTKHGNLGVTQTQQMIENEIALRMYPYCTRLIDKFVSEYCYLGGMCI